jgi:predicted DNA-binding transcriptional regulator YafY
MTLAQFHPAVAELFRLDTKFLERCRRNPNIFLIKTSPMEELTNWQMIQQLQKCINRSQKVEIDYYLEIDGGVQLHFAKFKPYRIVLEEGNWYLVGEDGEDPEMPVKALRIGFIRRVNPLPEEFKRKPEIKRFIENRQSLFSTFGRREERALIKVSPEVARFFKKKKFLASQRVVEERQDGLIVEYRFTNSMEILRLVKCWLPHLEVLEPLHLRKEVEVLLYQSLQRYSS